jgi:phosphoribosyl 1,2-cyclic phosphodiesterase
MSEMVTFSLQSGSNGNCIYVEAGDVRLLFDAGISGRKAEMRLRRHGRSARDCDALIISHDHTDHTSCAGVFARMFRLPIYISPRVHRSVQRRIGPVHDVRWYVPGDRLEFGDVSVHTFLTPHDGIDTVCFVVEHDRRRLGILTDLGHPFPALRTLLKELDAAYLESNYDAQMLWDGAYPEDLKQRIAGDGGHLSNDEAAALACKHRPRRMQWLALAHLSEENNRPELALETHRRELGRQFPLTLASRYDVSDVFHIT